MSQTERPNPHDVLDAMLHRLKDMYDKIELPDNDEETRSCPGEIRASFKISDTVNARLILQVWAGEGEPEWAAQKGTDQC